MKMDCFKDFKDLADYIIREAKHGRYTLTVLFYDGAINLLRELLSNKNVYPLIIDMESEEIDNYDKEYYITLDSDLELMIERAHNGERYTEAFADLALIDGNASSRIIGKIEEAECIEICLDGYEVEDLELSENICPFYDKCGFKFWEKL